ncbi:hypothetical protein HBI14_152290 [Parastagonospora nodorum]|nr:hypothetical protein HBI14_152290 [Parastagonospora nodorum]
MPWIFGRRKSGKPAKLKEGRAAVVTDRNMPVAAQSHLTRQQSARRRRTASRSAESMRDLEKLENIHPALRPNFPPPSTEDITALPLQHALQHSPHLRPIAHDRGTIPYNFQSHSHSSLPAAARERRKLQRPQSLRRDPAGESLVRRISSRRRREHDHLREEEIRAMTLPMPQKRPAGSSGGGMLRRDSKKVKGGLNHRFERPTSNVSLPFEDSVHSSMSSNSELRAFRVSTLDMFSPRPTIRFSVGSQYYSPDRSSPTTLPGRNDSRRERRPPSNRDEKQKNRTSRIDDLADSLDAGELREILERDKRRKDKKARAEQERLRRRLERRAEKQNAAAEIGGTPATPRREAVGAVGLGIEREVPIPMEDVRPSTPPPRPQQLVLPTTPKGYENSQLPTPLESPTEEPVVSDARAIRYSRGSVSNHVHARGPSNVSQLPELISEKLAQEMVDDSSEQPQDPFRSGSLHAVDTVETTPSKRGSIRRRSSDGRRMGVFAAFFRRGKRSSQEPGRTTPSEISFSNTSRESMARQPIPAHLIGTAPPTAPIQIKRPSSVPRRTMSRFREDLPEFPISPPDSRVESPDVPYASAIAARRRSPMPSDLRVESLNSMGGRSDSPVSPNAPTTNIMSQSLASVDSEASWLSGKPPKRASTQSQLRSGIVSPPVQTNEAFNASYEELGMADDEYFRRLSPQPDERRNDTLGRKPSSALMALDAALDVEEEQDPFVDPKELASEDEEHVRTVPGRQPTIIHRQPRVKSTEGLLSFYTNDKSAAEESAKEQFAEPLTPDSPDSPSFETEPMMVQRARSVDLGKHHVRHLSAGSARLLDISKQKRSSINSYTKKSEQD